MILFVNVIDDREIQPREIPKKICTYINQDRIQGAKHFVNMDFIVFDREKESVSDNRTGFQLDFLTLIRMGRDCESKIIRKYDHISIVGLCTTVFIVDSENKVQSILSDGLFETEGSALIDEIVNGAVK